MKVLFLTNIPVPYRVDFFNELGRYCELTVLFERSSAADREAAWLTKRNVFFRAEFLQGKNFMADNALCFAVTKWLHRELFDIFIVGGYSSPTTMLAIEVLSQRKIPFVLNADGGFIKKESNIKFQIKKHFITKASYYLSSGKTTSAFFQHFGANPGAIYEYPFTSLEQGDMLTKPLSNVDRAGYKRSLNIGEKKAVLSVGRFIYSKGFDVLIKACTMMSKEYGVYIVGGEPTPECIQIKEEYKLDNVHFISFKNKEELKNYYRACDLFVLPTRQDVWGLVINEAMACGLPIITTDRCIAGLELVDKDNGKIIPVNDVNKLAEAIIALLSNERELRRMGENSLKKIKPYSIENMAKAHWNIFEAIVQEAKVDVS